MKADKGDPFRRLLLAGMCLLPTIVIHRKAVKTGSPV